MFWVREDLIQINGIKKNKNIIRVCKDILYHGLSIIEKRKTPFNETTIQNTFNLYKNYLESKKKKKKQILEIRTWPPQFPNLSSTAWELDEREKRVWTEYSKSESELGKFLKNAWEGFKNCWKEYQEFVKQLKK